MSHILEVMQWSGQSDGDDDKLLDWMGRQGKHHMPSGTWLCQNINRTFTLAFSDKTRGDWAEPGDYVCRMSDATFEARKRELIDLLDQGDGAFHSRDYRDQLDAIDRFTTLTKEPTND